jgi:hypothetical protein
MLLAENVSRCFEVELLSLKPTTVSMAGKGRNAKARTQQPDAQNECRVTRNCGGFRIQTFGDPNMGESRRAPKTLSEF